MRARSIRFLICLFIVLAFVTAFGQTNTIRIIYRRTSNFNYLVDSLQNSFHSKVAKLTSKALQTRTRARASASLTPLSMPSRMIYVANRQELNGSIKAPGAPITLNFGTASRGFSASYQALLQSVLDTARPSMDSIFGTPATGGTINVLNYDADLGDRQVVAGGFFVPDNGSGQAEIHFPVYNSNEAAAVNFLHCLLLAYQGPNYFKQDAFQEGIVRAAVTKIARSGAMPGTLDKNAIENVLQASYDVGAFYDWYNQKALGGPNFIAPNLLTLDLPAGGSTGGVYLLRYLMAGSAWSKALVEYPNMISSLNQAVYANPTINTVPKLIMQCQAIMDAARGTGSTLEGYNFGEWFKRQNILDTAKTGGIKLLVDPVPITSNLQTADFGVFAVQANAFSTSTNGNETLLSGQSYPIFWDRDFLRQIPNVQDENLNIAGGYGSVVPNFPNLYSGQPYCMTIDVPFIDQITRVYVPAGAIATATQTTPNNLYGTLTGFTPLPGDIYKAKFWIGSNNFATLPVTNGAFGGLVADASFLGSASVNLQVFVTRSAGDILVLSRTVNKAPGALALDLRIGTEASQSYTLKAGIAMIGLGVTPFSSDFAGLLNLQAASFLAARFDAGIYGYDLYPNLEGPVSGHSYYLRLATPLNIAISGKTTGNTPPSIALRPGWNMFSLPTTTSVPLANIQLVRATDFPKAFTAAQGVEVAKDIFFFTPGAADKYSGVPETGTFTPNSADLQPGVGYFIQVLAPEGATLLFGTQNAGASIKAVSGNAPQIDNRTIFFLEGPSESAFAYAGTSPQGSGALNNLLDSPLPPPQGGIQVAFVEKGRMFNDIRSSNVQNKYTMVLSGLRPDSKYTIWTQLRGGAFRPFSMLDGEAGRTINYTRDAVGQYSFVAKANTKTLVIYLAAAK